MPKDGSIMKPSWKKVFANAAVAGGAISLGSGLGKHIVVWICGCMAKEVKIVKTTVKPFLAKTYTQDPSRLFHAVICSVEKSASIDYNILRLYHTQIIGCESECVT